MKYKKILVTGGAGFIGSNVAIRIKKENPKTSVTVLDNLSRRGSELNVGRLKDLGIQFLWGDVRSPGDLEIECDLIVECSAEPSVMAGINSSPRYLVETNLMGCFNCLEQARKLRADIIFLSTSRVYPIEHLNNLKFKEEQTRFSWLEQQIEGFSKKGINEKFTLEGARSLYGSTKLSSEHLISEYVNTFGIKSVINRCGLISGPWQMGKIDQGVILLWLSSHHFKNKLSYIGFGGKGKQVRDVLHIEDLYDLLKVEMENLNFFNGEIFNVGGGIKNAISLLELTKMCQDTTGNKTEITKDAKQRPGDIRIYITDNSKVTKKTKWKPTRSVEKVITDSYDWIVSNEKLLKNIF